jgi:hypothetical protein
MAKAPIITGTEHKRGISTRIITIKMFLAWEPVTLGILTQDSRQDTIKAIMVINLMTIAATTLDVVGAEVVASMAAVAMATAVVVSSSSNSMAIRVSTSSFSKASICSKGTRTPRTRMRLAIVIHRATSMVVMLVPRALRKAAKVPQRALAQDKIPIKVV